jgi:DNA-binding transcriptional regulator YiaG
MEKKRTNMSMAIEEIRKEKKMTPEELAEQSAVTIQDVHDFESGAKRPGTDEIIALAKGLKVIPFEIINYSLDKSKYFSKKSA